MSITLALVLVLRTLPTAIVAVEGGGTDSLPMQSQQAEQPGGIWWPAKSMRMKFPRRPHTQDLKLALQTRY